MEIALQLHQERVVAEKADLDVKVEKLEAFLQGAVFPTLAEDERHRLTRQLSYMKDYSTVLGQRIDQFNQPQFDVQPQSPEYEESRKVLQNLKP